MRHTIHDILLPFSMILLSNLVSQARETIDLSGQWTVRLDADDEGLRENWAAAPLSSDTTILLPGTTDLAGLGYDLNFKKMEYACPYPTTTRFPSAKVSSRVDEFGCLVRRHLFVGPAWYERTVNVPESWQNMPVQLRLERAMWQTRVWIDGQAMGSCDSLVAEHRYPLGMITPGPHRITVQVDNRLIHNIATITHAYGPETQSRWNGLIGKMRLERCSPVHIRHVATYPSSDRRSVRCAVQLHNASSTRQRVTLDVRLFGEIAGEPLAESQVTIDCAPNNSRHDVSLTLDKPAQPWDEFHTTRYKVVTTCQSQNQMDELTTRFGFRQVERVGKQIVINGQRVFLRGTLDCCVYPRTGHPPMDLEAWKKTLGVIKQYGFNHVRFHTWCPPQAAFEAADQLGLYLLAETPAWIDDWVLQTATHPKGIGHDPDVVAYLEAEIRRISDAYGNHPSFVMFTIGNEFGMQHTDWDCVSRMVQDIKQRDPRRLYSGCTARRCLDVDDYWITHRCGNQPARGIGPAHTDWDFNAAVATSPRPLIAHETGQRPVFPDYQRLLPKFRGPLLPLNYERHRRSLIALGLANQTEAFVDGSARFQELQYKAEQEGMLRTRDFSGYELLMLNDFTGQSEALVGVLDPFHESKGVLSISDVRSWNGPTTLLARFPKYVWTNNESFQASLLVAHFQPAPLSGDLAWNIISTAGTRIASGSSRVEAIAGGTLQQVGQIAAQLDQLPKATALTLNVQLGGVTNHWNFWSMPAAADAESKNVLVTRTLDEATIDALVDGAKVLWLAHGTKSDHTAQTDFPSVYWSAGWWGNQYSSLGILCDPAHPALTRFPTSDHSQWLWQKLCAGATTFDLTGAPAEFRPLVQPIPDFHFNHLLGQLFEAKVGAGALLVCGFDISQNLDSRPAARQLRQSLLEYVSADEFRPQQELPAAWLDQHFGPATLKPKDDGYRGIWFTLGQYSNSAAAYESGRKYWDFGDKYSGGLGTYTAKHVPIAIYAPQVQKTFFCYGGAKDGKRYLYNMISYYDHQHDRVPRPTIIHDKHGVNDPHDNSALAIDQQGFIWVYVAGRGRVRPGFVYRSCQPYEIDRFQLVSSDEICYPQPHPVPGQGILELFTKYTGVRELYWNVRHGDGSRNVDQKLAGMEGQYQTSYQQGERVVTAFNRHPGGTPDTRTDLYYLETRDMGKSWQSVDGVTIHPPLTDPDNPALVKAYSRDKRLVYLNSITLDHDGNPLILVVTSADHRAGPQGDPRTWEVLHHCAGQWHVYPVTQSTHNYDTGPLWVEPDGSWRIMGPTERGPQQWGCGGEIALWDSSDQGRTWSKVRDVTRNSPRNQTYVRRAVNAPHDSPCALLWADGNPDKESISRLYFSNAEGTVVRRLPYTMQQAWATPEVVTRPE